MPSAIAKAKATHRRRDDASGAGMARVEELPRLVQESAGSLHVRQQHHGASDVGTAARKLRVGLLRRGVAGAFGEALRVLLHGCTLLRYAPTDELHGPPPRRRR